ncbi:MAG: N-acetyltransferase [Henriciella sp.]|uniref:GNAT family N-acetyltransferase n=1 Tax=Henriciella sp. TaxID=1968823 RepID=UPI0032EC942D
MKPSALAYPEIGAKVLRAIPPQHHFERTDVHVARTLDDLQQVFAIRAAVFLAEQDCPFHEEYDGNDLASLHLVASVAGEPLATLRLRWFAGFGKVERVCILSRARGRKLDRILLAHAFEIAARKGYRLMMGQIQARLWPLWSRVLNCNLREGRPSFSFSGYDYLEILIPVPAHAEALTPQSAPYVLIRPEGSWDAAGILEQTALQAQQQESDQAA